MAAAGGGNTFTDILLTLFTTQGLSGYQAAMNQAATAAGTLATANAILGNQQLRAALTARQLLLVQGTATTAARTLIASQKAMESQMREASTAVLGLAASFSGLGPAMYPIFFAFYRAGSSIQFIVAALLALVGVVGATTRAFMDFEQANLHLGVALAQSGFGDSIQMWRDYADARQNATGIDREATMALSAQLIQLRFTRDEVLKLTPAIQAAAIARSSASGGRINTATLATQIAKSVATGDESALIDLGLDVRKIQRSANRVAEIHRQLVEKFGFAMTAYMETATSQQERLTSEWKSLFEEIGALFVPLMAAVRQSGILIAEAARGIVASWRWVLDQVTFGGFSRMAGTAKADAVLNEESFRNQGKMVSHLRSIDNKMDQFTTTMARVVLGGTGTRIREAATIRNFTPLARQRF